MTEFAITNPPVLSIGSHNATSGYGCAMEVLSWIENDDFTDYPATASTYAAQLVQAFNDRVGALRGKKNTDGKVVLLPRDAIRALELAFMTKDTNRLNSDYHSWADCVKKANLAVGEVDWLGEYGVLDGMRDDPDEMFGYCHAVLSEFRKFLGLDIPSIPSPETIDAARERFTTNTEIEVNA